MTKTEGANDRAERTRAALIDASVTLFGRRGYDAMTTREIALAANANVSSIKYHFGGKEELYRAALGSVVEEIQTIVDPVLAHLTQRVRIVGDDRDALRALAYEFASHWCRSVLGDRRLQRRIPCVVRELISPTASFELIYEGFFRHLYDALAELIAGVHGASALAAETRVRTHALVNLLLGFVQAESIFWRQMNWKRYTPERIEQFVPTVAQTFVAALG